MLNQLSQTTPVLSEPVLVVRQETIVFKIADYVVPHYSLKNFNDVRSKGHRPVVDSFGFVSFLKKRCDVLPLEILGY